MIGKTERRNESRGSLSRNLGEMKKYKATGCITTFGRSHPEETNSTTSFDVVVVYICVVSSSIDV